MKEIEGGVLQGEGTARSAHSSSDQLLLLQRELQCKPPEPGSGMRRGRSNKRETNILTASNTPVFNTVTLPTPTTYHCTVTLFLILDTPIASSVVTHCASSILANTSCYLCLLRLTMSWQECHIEPWRRLNCLGHFVQLGLTMPFRQHTTGVTYYWCGVLLGILLVWHKCMRTKVRQPC